MAVPDVTVCWIFASFLKCSKSWNSQIPLHLRIPNLKNTYANFLGQMCYKLQTSIFQIMQQNFALILWANSYSKRQCIALVPVAVTNIAIGQHMQTHPRVWQERQRQKRAMEERTESLSEKDDTKREREREWKKEIERQREREIKKEKVREREWARKKERERERQLLSTVIDYSPPSYHNST